MSKITRRKFLAKSSTVALSATMAGSMGRLAHGQPEDEIRIALVGCGGRGSGAVAQLFNASPGARLVAVADAFQARTDAAVKSLTAQRAESVDVPEERNFVGLDAYKKAIDSDCDLVVIATPPGFKPPQFEYAVSQGKHIFMEKPVATDAPGVRRVLAAAAESRRKKLLVGVGLQRRHEPRYMETIKRVQDGAIGELILARVYWNGRGIWYRDRQPDQTEMAFQCHNWYHFNWICGDQIVEQHIHNLDVGCWAKGAYPVECNGMGGGEQRVRGDRSKSQIFDHTFCEYTFADGTKMYSQGRHLQGGWENVSEALHGTKGTSNPAGWIEGEKAWRFEGESPGGHQQEQHDLIEALVTGEYYNEAEYGARSTFTAILGREACYSGKIVKWDELLEHGRNLTPGIDDYTMDSAPPAMHGPDGLYPVPVPGEYSPFEKS